MDKLAYHYNKQKKQVPNSNKFYYYYPLGEINKSQGEIVKIGKERYVRIELEEKIFDEVFENDRLEYNNERRFFNKKWIQQAPTYENSDEDDESGNDGNDNVTDFWREKCADEKTKTQEKDICERMDREAVLECFSDIDYKIYNLNEQGNNQSEIAKELKLNQSNVARRLEIINNTLNRERFDDGTRNKTEIIFEMVWEEYSRYKRTPHNEDMIVQAFNMFIGPILYLSYLEWFYSPKEYKRFAIRSVIEYNLDDTKDYNEMKNNLSKPAIEFYKAKISNLDEVYKYMFLRLTNEMERRVRIFGKTNHSHYKKIEERLNKNAERRKITYEQYVEHIIKEYREQERKTMLRFGERFIRTTKDVKLKNEMRKAMDNYKKQKF